MAIDTQKKLELLFGTEDKEQLAKYANTVLDFYEHSIRDIDPKVLEKDRVAVALLKNDALILAKMSNVKHESIVAPIAAAAKGLGTSVYEGLSSRWDSYKSKGIEKTKEAERVEQAVKAAKQAVTGGNEEKIPDIL